MNYLISIDYKILDFIKNKGEATKEELLNKFPNEKFATEYRISLLKGSSSDINEIHIETEPDEFGIIHIKYLGKYYLTELGKKTIYDNEIIKNEKNKNFWIEKIFFSVIVPCVIAFITTYFSK